MTLPPRGYSRGGACLNAGTIINVTLLQPEFKQGRHVESRSREHCAKLFNGKGTNPCDVCSHAHHNGVNEDI